VLEVRGAGDWTNTDLLVTAWRKGKDVAVVAANITDHDAQGLIAIGDLPKGETFEVRDQLSDGVWKWSRQDLDNGLYVRLRSGDAHLFLIKAI